MTDTIQAERPDRIVLILGWAALILAIAMVVLLVLNTRLQAQVAEGQQKIAQAQAAANVNNSLIRLLAKSATEDHDAALQGLLAQNGITVQAQPADPAAAAPAAPATPANKDRR